MDLPWSGDRVTRLLVWEQLSAAHHPMDGPPSLHREGRAMLLAILRELTTVEPSLGVLTLLVALHHRQQPLSLQGILPDRSPHAIKILTIGARPAGILAEVCASAHDVILVAPESDDVLFDYSNTVIQHGGRILGCDSATVQVFADKWATARLLGAATIPTQPWDDEQTLPTTFEKLLEEKVVVKPRYGAGARHTLVGPTSALSALVERARQTGCTAPLIVQPFYPGMPASFALVGNGRGQLALLPGVEQHLRRIPHGSGRETIEEFTYDGGRLPLPSALQPRIERLRDQLLAAWPSFKKLRGFVGVDILLGQDLAGHEDRIMEINPRFTTSLVGYQHLYPGQMAPFLLGFTPDAPTFTGPDLAHDKHWCFRSDGTITWQPAIPDSTTTA